MTTTHDPAATLTKPTWSVHIGALRWTAYEDDHLPGGEHAAQVKIITPSLFVARFPPGFTAPAHSHPYDTIYYVKRGSIRFGDEDLVGVGGFRGVKAEHAYGPEAADPKFGCEFILWSAGPISINWVDHLDEDALGPTP